MKLTYEQKIEKTYDVIYGSNSSSSDRSKPERMADLLKDLMEMGAETDELLREASYEDIVAGLHVQPLKAKLIARIWRNQIEVKQTYNVPIQDQTVEMLVDQFEPAKLFSPITSEMVRRFKDKPIIVFVNDEFNKEATLKQIELLESGLPIDKFFNFNGQIGNAYSVGYGPFRVKDSCPIHTDMPLVEGRCVKCQKTWLSLDLEKRYLAYYTVKTGLIEPNNRQQVASLFNMLNSDLNEFKETYPEAYDEYLYAVRKKELPGMKLDIGCDYNSNSPFGKNKKY